MALLMVIAAVAILTILAVGVAARANVTVFRATRSTRDAGFRRGFDSGCEVAKGLIEEAPSKGYDYFGDPWYQRVEVYLGAGTALSGRGPSTNSGQGGPSHIVVEVFDESGKINVSADFLKGKERAKTVRRLNRLFGHLQDRPKMTGTQGISQHDAGRGRSPAPLASIREAVMKRLGLTDTSGWAAIRGVEGLLTLDGLREGDLTREEVFGDDGLHQYLTCFGDGRININTAPAAVLFSLDDEFDEKQVEEIVRWRGVGAGSPRPVAGDAAGSGSEAPFHSQEDPDRKIRAFQTPKDLEMVPGIVHRSIIDGNAQTTRNLFLKVRGDIDVMSTAFSARIRVMVGEKTKEAWAYFEPLPPQQQKKQGVRLFERVVYEEIEP